MSAWKGKRVAVLYGGRSSEREVSLRTGAAIHLALRERGHDAELLDVGLDVAERLRAAKADVAFVALHGRYGEDGCIQGLLESMGIPYTGSGVIASAAGMDKVVAKQAFRAAGIPTPEYVAARQAKAVELRARDLPFGLPAVVKPAREGSSVGVRIVKDEAQLAAALQEAAKFKGDVLVERYHKGREVQGAVLDGKGLGVIEIRPATEFYDYQAKYHSGGTTQYLFPAPLPKDVYARVLGVCVAAHEALGCEGATRSDVIVGEDGGPVLLEINTLPGMTAASLLPKIAAGVGIDFGTLCERILDGASLKA